MQSIVEACSPRRDILEGTFNPEIFTASLSQVMNAYRGEASIAHRLYTDAEQFFGDGTYPTEGLRMVLADVFGRLAGQNPPAIHRLETAFGGGKTHILIALAHLGFRGRELASVTQNIVDSTLLQAPGDVAVVGVAGDEIPVHKPKGTRLVPYTLWGEIAYQIGGEALYRSVEQSASSFAAPDVSFLERILSGRKAIIMMDELAQYAARLEAARPNGGEQLAAFLMSLNGYARTHSGIAVVVTLASHTDAFGRQTEQLRDLLGKVRGEEVPADEAASLADRAEAASRSVVSRDASTVIPVRAGEISRVLAVRLLESRDPRIALEVASAYMAMYAKSGASLPDQAVRSDFREVMASHYPFHPTFIDFLNKKLSTLETFQGTRGVLRVLALTIRSIWDRKIKAPMIHSCHVDFRDSRTLNEIIGRTGSGELLPIINADIGGPDTAALDSGRSQAELADRRNPHPAGHPLHEYTWKTVFLHSLVGRSQGLGSNLFGISEKDALFEVSFPGLTPPQVETALREIKESAYYLRSDQGRYYASLEPSVNIVLAQIRRGIADSAVDQLLDASVRKLITSASGTFRVVHDVSLPEHVPDNLNQPTLAVVAVNAREVDVQEFLTTVGPNRPRIQQNQVFLLVPGTVHVKGELWSEERVRRAMETLNRLKDLGRWVLAMRRLKEKPENYGIQAARLNDSEFLSRQTERELALQTSLAGAFDTVWYPSASGQIGHDDIKTAGGEGGFSIVEEIKRTLDRKGELITPDRAATGETLQALSTLFFESDLTPSVTNLRDHFFCKRHWPILDQPTLLGTVIREGVNRGVWCLFKMEGPESTKPEAIYSSESGSVPLDLDLTARDWSIVSVQGARQRGWIGEQIDPATVEKWVADVAYKKQSCTIGDLCDEVRASHGEVPKEKVTEAVERLSRSEKLFVYTGKPEQDEKPDKLIRGASAITHRPKEDEVIIVPSEASKRGWISVRRNVLTLFGNEGAEAVMPILGRIGSFYNKGASSTVKTLELSDLELPDGGRLQITLEDVPPQSMKKLNELFQILSNVARQGDQTGVSLVIEEPDENCAFVRAIRKK
jgi:hypothetical protein